MISMQCGVDDGERDSAVQIYIFCLESNYLKSVVIRRTMEKLSL